MRTTKTVNGTAHTYIYASGKLLRETYGSNTLDFFYDASGTPFALKHNGTLYYYITNLQGDVMQLVNSSGAVVASYEYDPYGNIVSSSGTMASINPLRYRSYYFDSETGFYYLQSRYYDPAVGRFINADSYASTGQGIIGHNMFTYCGNNPANYIDYFGNRLSHFSYVAWDGCLSAGSNEDGNEEDQSFYYTGSVGLTGSYCINGIFYFGQVSMVTDAFGNSEIQFSYGSGFTTGDAGGSLMLNMAFTNAPTAQHLHGMGYALGGTYSNAAFDLMFVPDSNANNTYWGFSFSGGFGSAEAHASMSNTVYAIPIDFNLFEFADLVYKSYWGIYE